MRKKKFYNLSETAKESGLSEEEVLESAYETKISLFVKPKEGRVVFSCDLQSTNIDDQELLEWKSHPRRIIVPNKDNIPRKDLNVHALLLSQKDILDLIETESCEASFFLSGIKYKNIPITEVIKPSKFPPSSNEQFVYCLYGSKKEKFRFNKNLGYDRPLKISFSWDDVLITKFDVNKLAYSADNDGRAYAEADDLIFLEIYNWLKINWNFENASGENYIKLEAQNLIRLFPSRIRDLAAVTIKVWGMTRSGELDKTFFEKDLRRIRNSKGDTNLENYIKGAFQVASKKFSVSKKLVKTRSMTSNKIFEEINPSDPSGFKETIIRKMKRNDAVVSETSVMDLIGVWCDLFIPYHLDTKLKRPTAEELLNAVVLTGIRSKGSDYSDGVVRYCLPMFGLDDFPER